MRAFDTVQGVVCVSTITSAGDHFSTTRRGVILVRGRMVEASKQFRRVNGFMHPPALRSALEAHFAKGDVTASKSDHEKEVAA